jgi:purine-cytosine permease-like protein
VIGVVVAGQILSAVSDFRMTLSVGILISSILSYLVTVLGLSFIHTVEKYAWIPSVVLFLVLVGQASPHVSPSAPSAAEGLELAGIFLSYTAIIFAYASGWAPIAADYFCSYPATTPQWKIFVLVYGGLSTACIFACSIGACVGSAALAYAPYGDAYNEHGFGALISAVYHPVGWSKFALVVFSFTVISQNTVMIYSNGLAAQLLGDYFHAVPRFVWSFVVICAVLLLGLIGQEHLSDIITDFVSLLGYWAVAFATIVFIEDRVFRRRSGYDLRVWDDAKLLPVGAAAVASLFIGYCAGGLPGMDQTWYVGPIAKSFGGFGGDVGDYLAFGFTLVSYPILRTIERRVTGK